MTNNNINKRSGYTLDFVERLPLYKHMKNLVQLSVFVRNYLINYITIGKRSYLHKNPEDNLCFT